MTEQNEICARKFLYDESCIPACEECKGDDKFCKKYIIIPLNELQDRLDLKENLERLTDE